MKRSFMISFCILLSASGSAWAQITTNEFAKNVKTYSKKSTYENEYDTSKFRLGILNSNFTDQAPRLSRVPSSYTSIASKLKDSATNVCKVVKNKKGLKFKDSSAYVVSALKKAGSIAPRDKNYSLNSAHFLWELYLSYRDFVDISQPIAREDGPFSLSKLPNATIVTLEKGCNENGIAAIHCDGKFYAPKFVDIPALESRINDPADQTCKLGKGLRVIAEADRFLQPAK